MLPKPPALILAGGMSSRMGFDKAHAQLQARPLFFHVCERLAPQVSQITINSNDPQRPSPFGETPTIADNHNQSLGPLLGIYRGMQYYRTGHGCHFLTVPVDCPFIPLDMVEKLSHELVSDHDIIVARSNSRNHPTIGLWPVALHDHLRDWLTTSQHYSVMAFLDNCHTRFVEFPLFKTATDDVDPFFNINNRQNLEQAEDILQRLNSCL